MFKQNNQPKAKRKSRTVATVDMLDEKNMSMNFWDGNSEEPSFTLARDLSQEPGYSKRFVPQEEIDDDPTLFFLRETPAGTAICYTIGVGALGDPSRKFYIKLGSPVLFIVSRVKREDKDFFGSAVWAKKRKGD